MRGNVPRPSRADGAFLSFCTVGAVYCFLRRTPGPSPFSAMKITPAASSAFVILSKVVAYPLDAPFSNRVIVMADTPEISARSLTPSPRAVRAILHCTGVITVNIPVDMVNIYT